MADPMLEDWRSCFYPRDTYTDEASAAERLKRVKAGQFVMQRDAPGGAKQFRAFVSIEKAYEFIVSQPQDDRTFYETIFQEHRQKPHFDLDIVPSPGDAMDHAELLNRLLTEIKRVVGPNLDLVNDVGVYSSHAPDGTKKSYHVILIGYFVNDNVEAGNFAKAVRDGMVAATEGRDSPAGLFITKCVDLVVYKKVQQFRLLGCTKLGRDRHKTIVLEYSAAGRARKRPPVTDPYAEFCRSLVSLVPEDSKLLEAQCYARPAALTSVDATLHAMMRRNLTGEAPTIDPDSLWLFDATRIVSHLIDKQHLPGSLANSCRHHTVASTTQGALIGLRAPRAGGYWCLLCEREHEHENPYLTLHADTRSEAATEICPRVVAIIYRCRRDPTSSIRVCSMRGGGPTGTSSFTCEDEPYDPRQNEIFTRQGEGSSAVDA